MLRVPCLLLLLCNGAALAAEVPCGAGTRVLKDEGGTAGEIAEVGTESPHVGWYRLVFGWNAPRGDWYDPRLWPIFKEGTGERCVVPTATPAPAAAKPEPSAPATTTTPQPRSTDRCPAGRKVIDRKQKRGTVLGEKNGFCVVQLADGSRDTYLQWMLSDDGGSTAASTLETGNYVCSTNGAGHFPIELRDASSYVDRAGKAGSYRIDAGSGKIEFTSGSLESYHSKVLGPRKFGLASEATTQFHTVCNRKKQ